MTLPSMQRNLLGLTLLIVVGLTVFLLSRKLTLEARKRDGLLLDMIANISGSLDRLDGGLNDIVSQTGTARNRLRHLVALHRENLLVCALLGEKQRHRRMSGEEKTTKVRRVAQSSITDSKASCQSCGPGYRSPKAAMLEGPREKLLYVVGIHTDPEKADVLCTVDVDPDSPTYCQIIHKLRMLAVGDELHHSGWNICSSCHNSSRKRDTLVLPSLMSDRVYFVDTSDEKTPKIKKVLEPEEMHKYGISTPHTSHCLPTGEILISTMGNLDGDGLGEFFCIDAETLETKDTWTRGQDKADFGYDFWYQPYYDTLVASEWGAPRVFKTGYIPDVVYDPKIYGRSLNIYSWNERKLKQTINLGEDGIAPLEIRFLHDPLAAEGFVGCAVSSNVYRFYKAEDNSWRAEKVIQVLPKKVEGWISPLMSGMITDILLSLDDKYLYLSNWLHGDVRQYDISDTRNPKLTGQVFLGGSILSDSQVRVIEDEEMNSQPDPVYVKGRRLHGAPQMLQLSLDGRRLYVTTAIFKPWDKQFYPDLFKYGSTMVKLDVDVEKGDMKLDPQFLVDFGADKSDILLAHEMRYPGGDCTSDIWLP